MAGPSGQEGPADQESAEFWGVEVTEQSVMRSGLGRPRVGRVGGLRSSAAWGCLSLAERRWQGGDWKYRNDWGWKIGDLSACGSLNP